MRPRTLRLALAKATVTLTTAFVALALGLSGCSDDDGGGTPTFPVVGSDTALLRVAHLSPDAGTVSVIVDEGGANGFRVDDVSFGVFSRFYEIPATFAGRQVSLKVRAAGTDVLDVDFEVLRGQVLTAAVVGKANPQIDDGSGGFVDALRPIVVEGTVDPSPDEATVGFVHAVPSVGEVVVTAANISSPPLFAATAFGEATGRGTELPPLSYDLQVRPTATGDVAVTFSDVALAANRVYTLWAVETPEGAVQALATIDRFDTGSATSPTITLTPATAGLRAAHLSAEAGGVQIVVDGTVVTGLENVGYRTISGELELTAATHRVEVFDTAADPTSAAPLLAGSFTLAPGTSLTFAATGTAQGDVAAQSFVYAGQVPPGGSALVRTLHATSYPRTYALTFDDGENEIVVASRVDPGSAATGYQVIPAGTYTLRATLPDLGDFLAAEVADVVVEEGTVLNVYFVGIAGAAGDSGLDLLVDVQPSVE